MTEIKKYPKRLRGRDQTIMVDEQILNWRRKMRKEGIVLGKHRAKQIEVQAKRVEERHEEKDILSGKMNFFGVDEE